MQIIWNAASLYANWKPNVFKSGNLNTTIPAGDPQIVCYALRDLSHKLEKIGKSQIMMSLTVSTSRCLQLSENFGGKAQRHTI